MSLPPEDRPTDSPRPNPLQQAHLELTTQRPVVTYVLVGVTLLVFLVEQFANTNPLRELLAPLLSQVISPQVEEVLRARGLFVGVAQLLQSPDWNLLLLLGAKINPLIEIGQVWRLFTPALLHSSFIQVGFNMFALYSFGAALEPFYGRQRFLALYWLAVFGGNVLSFLFSNLVSNGAATGVFGLVAAQGVFLYQNRAIFGTRGRTNLIILMVVIGLNLLLGTLPGFDNWASVGGLMAGLAFAWSAGPRFAVVGEFPLFHLEDTRSARTVWLSAFLVAVVAAVMAIVGNPAL